MEKLSYRIFISILIFSPLAFGTVEPWSILIMEGGVLLALLLFLVSKSHRRESLVKVPGILPLFLLLGYMVLQIIPLPAGVVHIVSPAAFKLFNDTIGVLHPVEWMQLSIDRHETILELFRFATYMGAYILTVQLFSQKKYLTSAVATVIIFASVLSFLSILERYTGGDNVFWFRSPVNVSNFGPYNVRNHYAGFAGMMLPLLTAMFFYCRPDVSYTTFKEKVVEFLAHPRSHIYFLLGMSAVILAASIFISLSRGGIISACLSLGLLGVVLSRHSSGVTTGITFATLCVVILVTVGWFGWSPVFNRFNNIRNEEGRIELTRVQLYKDSADIIRDFSITGTGFGTYKRIYPAYRTVPGRSVLTHAHNDYLELATEGGLIGVVLFGWFSAAIIRRSLSRILKRRDTYLIHLFWGTFAGIVYMLLHSLVDYNLHIGANGLFFFFLFGLLVSASHTRMQGKTRSSYLVSFRKPVGAVVVIATAIIFMGSLATAVGSVYTKHALQVAFHELFEEGRTPRNIQPSIEKLSKAATIAPFNYLLPLMQGAACNDTSIDTPPLPLFQKALVLSPSIDYTHQKLAEYYANEKQDLYAEGFFKAAILYAPLNNEVKKLYADWLLDHGRENDGIACIRQAIEIEPENTEDYLVFLIEKGIDEQNLTRALPDRVAPRLAYAKKLDKDGITEQAEAAFEKALRYMDREENIRNEYFFDISSFYENAGRFEDALRVIRMAVSYLPEDPAVRLRAARLYETCDIPYRAIEEYEKVVFLEPGNGAAKKRLAALRGEN